jgi:transposase InsO family protein
LPSGVRINVFSNSKKAGSYIKFGYLAVYKLYGLTLTPHKSLICLRLSAWVSDITYVRTYEGFLYVATVMDLFSRRIVGWSIDKNMDKHLVINALPMAVYQRQPKAEVMVQVTKAVNAAVQTTLHL